MAVITAMLLVAGLLADCRQTKTEGRKKEKKKREKERKREKAY
jgi:hypothetical protein